MFLISWNVAGWSSTSQAIRESFGSIHDFFACTEADIICLQECKGTLARLNAAPVDMGASDPPASRRPVVGPLARLAAQRTRAQRAAGPGKSGASPAGGGGGGSSDGIEGWESFWSLSGKQHRGFNGVVTFARKGLTWRCDSEPFADAALNDEGRVVVTHHSAFVLVNVYVPNARGGARHAFKFRFLLALEEKMEQLRVETQKPVILVGDLNMTYRAHDAAWSLRRIHLGALLQLVALADATGDAAWAAAMPDLSKAALRRVANMIANHLCTQAQEMTSGADGVAVLAASPATSPAASSPGTGVVSVDSEVSLDEDTMDEAALRRLCAQLPPRGAGGAGRGGHNCDTPPVPLQLLYDVGFRTAHASEYVKAFPCTHNSDVYAVVHYCGLAPHSDASAQFMGRLLQLRLPVSSAPLPEGRLPWSTAAAAAPAPAPRRVGLSKTRMWDTFLLTAELATAAAAAAAGGAEAPAAAVDAMLLRQAEASQRHPYCPCPYTCWDQSRNRRLENEGTRLDYILVDTALLPAVVCRAETANNVLAASPVAVRQDDFFSEVHGAEFRDGVARAMANGAYPPAPFDGTGMPALSEQARELCCAGLPSTGLVVTPPQFSDHIGVGLLLDLGALGAAPSLLPRPGKVVEDHTCMYRPPVGLHTFFAAAAAAKKVAVPVTAPAAPRDDGAADRRGARGMDARTAGQKRGADGGVVRPSLDGDALVSAAPSPPIAVHSEAVVDARAPHRSSEPAIIDVDDL
ncbi:endonuclease/exonuclease protein-like protein [Novymonas esmeraldas]|uniref:Endonuclease/exonuclease protein-like protein n=1 Tax=Novymonas esmeraldas TaxID=1808958 RepID=A0AAW0EIR0_9TRYP